MPELVLLGRQRPATAGRSPRGRPPVTSAVRRTERDPRYGLMRWRRLAKRVLVRDLHVCRVVAGCPKRATVADHIVPATLEMPDWQFFDPDNLRAACRDHNLARVVEALAPPSAEGPSAVITDDFT